MTHHQRIQAIGLKLAKHQRTLTTLAEIHGKNAFHKVEFPVIEAKRDAYKDCLEILGLTSTEIERLQCRLIKPTKKG
jgi:hypothetical protein